MYLNTIRPGIASKFSPKRVGRGIGSGLGKTCGRGHKGQHARAGGYHKVGFEGGQMPLQRRIPKRGFYSRRSVLACEVRLDAISKLEIDRIDLLALKRLGIISPRCGQVKIIASGSIQRAVHIEGVLVTAGAVKAIEAVGGSVSD